MTPAKTKDQVEHEITYHILEEIKRLSRASERIDEKLDTLSEQYQGRLTRLETELKIKGGMWGLLGGALITLPPVLFFIYRMLSR